MIAHALTGLRLLLAIPVAWACADPDLMPGALLLLLILVAVATDFFDGRLARRLGTGSPAGMLFDHATDFLFVTSALFGAARAGVLTVWLPVLIVVAFSQYIIDSYWLYRQKQLRMSFLGRWNGILYFLPIGLLAVARLNLMASASAVLHQAVGVLALALLASTAVSIIDRGVAPLRSR